MYTYAVALKPVVMAGGINALSEDKKRVFEGMLFFMSRLIECANEVESVEIMPDYSLLVKATEEVDKSLKKLGENAIVSRID